MKAAISSHRLEQILKVKTKTIKLYLCRTEFKHIVYTKNVFYNISEEDVERLQNIISNRKGSNKDKPEGNKSKLSEYTCQQLHQLKKEIEEEIRTRKATSNE